MADWTNLPNTAVGVGGLPSGTTVTALRDNPIALAEKAASIPIGLRLGTWLVATVTFPLSTASLTTFDVTGLNISDFEFLNFVGNGFAARGIRIGGVALGQSTGGLYGNALLNLNTGRIMGYFANDGATAIGVSVGNTGYSKSTTTINFQTGSGSFFFDGGQMLIYGVR